MLGPVVLVPIDPRMLLASQPFVVRHHAAYYLEGEWERTGLTSADRRSLANRWPIVAFAGERGVILSGHHRSLRALLSGVPLLARTWSEAH